MIAVAHDDAVPLVRGAVDPRFTPWRGALPIDRSLAVVQQWFRVRAAAKRELAFDRDDVFRAGDKLAIRAREGAASTDDVIAVLAAFSGDDVARLDGVRAAQTLVGLRAAVDLAIARERPRLRDDLVAERGDGGVVDVMALAGDRVVRLFDAELAVACGMTGERGVTALVSWAKAELGLVTTPAALRGVIALLADAGCLDAQPSIVRAARSSASFMGDTPIIPVSPADVAKTKSGPNVQQVKDETDPFAKLDVEDVEVDDGDSGGRDAGDSEGEIPVEVVELPGPDDSAVMVVGGGQTDELAAQPAPADDVDGEADFVDESPTVLSPPELLPAAIAAAAAAMAPSSGVPTRTTPRGYDTAKLEAMRKTPRGYDVVAAPPPDALAQTAPTPKVELGIAPPRRPSPVVVQHPTLPPEAIDVDAPTELPARRAMIRPDAFDDLDEPTYAAAAAIYSPPPTDVPAPSALPPRVALPSPTTLPGAKVAPAAPAKAAPMTAMMPAMTRPPAESRAVPLGSPTLRPEPIDAPTLRPENNVDDDGADIDFDDGDDISNQRTIRPANADDEDDVDPDADSPTMSPEREPPTAAGVGRVGSRVQAAVRAAASPPKTSLGMPLVDQPPGPVLGRAEPLASNTLDGIAPPRRCTTCGEMIEPNFAFCVACGTPVAIPALPPMPMPMPTPAQRPMPAPLPPVPVGEPRTRAVSVTFSRAPSAPAAPAPPPSAPAVDLAALVLEQDPAIDADPNEARLPSALPFDPSAPVSRSSPAGSYKMREAPRMRTPIAFAIPESPQSRPPSVPGGAYPYDSRVGPPGAFAPNPATGTQMALSSTSSQAIPRKRSVLVPILIILGVLAMGAAVAIVLLRN